MERDDERGFFPRIKAYVNQEVQSDVYIEAVLMILSISAGINETTTYPGYGVFTSSQTGNTALLAVAALSLESSDHKVNLRLVSASLGTFIAGALVFGRFGHKVGYMHRGWLLTTLVLQTVLVFTAAALRRWYATNNALIDSSLSVVMLLAFQSAAQVSLARTVSVPEVSTAMLTTVYVDAFVDPLLLAKQNRPRERRMIFILCFITGCFIGAVGYRYEGPALSILLSGTLKTVACIITLFTKGKSRLKKKEHTHSAVPESALTF